MSGMIVSTVTMKYTPVCVTVSALTMKYTAVCVCDCVFFNHEIYSCVLVTVFFHREIYGSVRDYIYFILTMKYTKIWNRMTASILKVKQDLPNTKRFKRMLIYFDTDTQYTNFQENPPCQATKQHLNHR